ncbi:hypothetical protein ACHWQZ_G012971 [Mnemiopsis leidyi]
MEATKFDMFFVWIITILIIAIITSLLIIWIMSLKMRLELTERKLSLLTTNLLGLMNGQSLNSVAGDLEAGGTSTKRNVADTCSIQLVQDWLEEPDETEETDQPVLDQLDCWGVPLSAYENNCEKYKLKTFQFKLLENKDPGTWPLYDLDEGSVISSEESVCDVRV